MENKRILFHEAGHAVAAAAVGLEFSGLSSDTPIGSTGLVLKPALHLSEDVSFARLKEYPFRKSYVLATVAGAAAESIAFLEDGLLSLHSGVGSEDFLKLAYCKIPALESIFCYYEVRLFLQSHWDKVQALASALEAKPIMLKEEILQAIGDVPAFYPKKVEKVEKLVVLEPEPEQISFKDATRHIWMAHLDSFEGAIHCAVARGGL